MDRPAVVVEHDVTAADAKSVSPSESMTAVHTRRLIILSFWLVVVCLGLPFWLWTTSIHRSDLPLDLMRAWDGGKTCQFQYPLYIRLDASPVFDNYTQSIVSNKVQKQLDELPHLGTYRFQVAAENHNVRNGIDSDQDWALTVIMVESPSPHLTLEPWAAVLTMGIGSEASLDAMAAMIAQRIHQIFQDDEESITYLLDRSPFASGRQSGLSPARKALLDARTTRAFRYASTYHLTFSLFTSSALPSAWDIETALQTYIAPLLGPFSRISRFTIDTQLQLHASFSPSISGPLLDESTGEWRLQTSDLSGFINAAEWPLSPSIGEGPTINFVLYIPSPEQSPLVISESGGSSWLIPQWGGVQILNLDARGGARKTLTAEGLEPVMLTFADQLTSLLGLAPTPPSLSLRISSLTRERATSLILSASSTLGALARLTLKLTSIAIPSSVSTSVSSTLQHLNLACEDLKSGRYDQALENARIAEGEAEQAFFEPSMVGQVYFPDEHKVAVYVPLLGPMAVPLIMAAVKELRALRHLRKGKIE